jgi:hypothetical protein
MSPRAERGVFPSTSLKDASLRYLIRHTAFHTLDHAWEMEDKDLSAFVGV